MASINYRTDPARPPTDFHEWVQHFDLYLATSWVITETGSGTRAIAQAKAADSGKPANIAEKMVEGSVQKFLREITLLGQPFVKDDKQTVEQLLKSRHAKVVAFHLYVVGEGLEKRKDDFVAEVMAQAQQAQKDAGKDTRAGR